MAEESDGAIPRVSLRYDKILVYTLLHCVQSEPAARQQFGQMEAVDSLLQQLAYYKRHDPAQQEEVGGSGETYNKTNCINSG